MHCQPEVQLPENEGTRSKNEGYFRSIEHSIFPAVGLANLHCKNNYKTQKDNYYDTRNCYTLL